MSRPLLRSVLVFGVSLLLTIMPWRTLQAESNLPLTMQELSQITIDYNKLLQAHNQTLSEALTESKDLTSQLQSFQTKISDLEKQLQDSQMTSAEASKLVEDLKTQLLDLSSKLKDSQTASINFLKDSETFKNDSTMRIQRVEKERDLAEAKAVFVVPVSIVAILDGLYIVAHFLGWVK